MLLQLTGVSRANDVNFVASAFELESPESQRWCQQEGPQLKHGPISTNHHLNHKSMPGGSWAVDFPPWHNRDYLARAPWWLLLQTGTRTRTVITQAKDRCRGAEILHCKRDAILCLSIQTQEFISLFACRTQYFLFFLLQSLYWTQI